MRRKTRNIPGPGAVRGWTRRPSGGRRFRRPDGRQAGTGHCIMSQQLTFSWDLGKEVVRPEPPPAEPESGASQARRQAIRRAVLRWLEQTAPPPTGVATQVVTRIQRTRADVAAFWSAPVRNSGAEGPGRVLAPVRTAIIQCYAEREECWPECSRSQELLPRLKGLKKELADAEAAIRAAEPHLRDPNALFEEYAVWRYEESRNRTYHRLRRAISRVERSLYEGSSFERIRSAQLADHLYLAVPAGLVEGSELADGWGLLWVDDDLTVRVIVPAEARETLPANRFHLVQNIAAAAKASELLANGVAQRGNEVILTRPMRRRRAEERVRLSAL